MVGSCRFISDFNPFNKIRPPHGNSYFIMNFHEAVLFFCCFNSLKVKTVPNIQYILEKPSMDLLLQIEYDYSLERRRIKVKRERKESENVFESQEIGGRSTTVEWYRPVFAQDQLTSEAVITRLVPLDDRKGLVEVVITSRNQEGKIAVRSINEIVIKRLGYDKK